MSAPWIRLVCMTAFLAAGSMWLRPEDPARLDPGVRYEEIAQAAGCANRHTAVQLSPRFANIMPWLASVGAAVAAADFDGDGRTDLYVTNSGRGSPNRLFHNRGDGTFVDLAGPAGVACGNPEGASMHAIFGDVDQDGRPDLYLVKWGAGNQLFLNQGDGTFRDVTARAGVGYWGYGNAATFVDYDRDGHLDILVGNYFADSLPDPRIGRLVRSDLWNPVTTRVMHSTFTHADNGGRTLLYRNRGDGTFAEVAEASGITFRGWTLAVGAADLNQDGWPDLYLANDFGPDELYLNTGAIEQPPRFRRVVDTSGHPGIGNDWWKGMNVDFGDVDGNGSLDIYVTNIRARHYKSDEGNMLWLNLPDPGSPGGRRFRDAAKPAGVDDGGWGWGAKFLDANNDGLLDILALNGFVTGNPERTYWYALQEMVTQTKNNSADAADWPVMGDRDLSGGESSRLFIQVPPARGRPARDATPRFVDAAARAGITDAGNGRGLALLDLDDDGVLDFYVANQAAPSLLYRGRLLAPPEERLWIGLALVGRPDRPRRVGRLRLASTTGAVGARVELEAGGRLLVREVSGGSGFASQSESRLHFGLGARRPERLTVRWPSGLQQSFSGEALGSCLGGYARLVEGGVLEPGAGAAPRDAPPVADAAAAGAVAAQGRR
jgi:hypothetical protein